ncbi:hypothetical protein [Hominenteromicrobium sp.]|uniref:hypothetical protein n=1 Tax=Hominenteromicrobium sp. TaxID=3073581 RepID=UPI003AB86C89
MFKVNAYVTEIVPDNLYEVDIDGFTTTVAGRRGVDVSNWKCDVEVDDSAVTFKSALIRVLELNYGDCDFDFICCGVKDGIGCYVVTIYDYVW